MTELIEITTIIRNGDTQTRVGLNPITLAEYAEEMIDGVLFPSIVVYRDEDGNLWLADGFHRVVAALKAGLKEINADVRIGEKRDAILHSVGANATHGLRRTNEDKRRAIATLLRDQEWRTWSDNRISQKCGVSDKTVANLRAQLESGSEIPKVSERVGQDGKTYPVKHWGMSNGTAFWKLIEKFKLDKSSIMEQLQPGAKVLTDLTASKEDTWRRLDQLATERVAKLFPVDSYIRHYDGYMGKVLQAHPTVLRVYDYKYEVESSWATERVDPSTPEAFAVWKAAEAQAAHNVPPPVPELTAPDVGARHAVPVSDPSPTALALKEGDTVRNIHSGVEGKIVGFQGDAARIEGPNGARLVKRAYLETVPDTTPQSAASAVGTQRAMSEAVETRHTVSQAALPADIDAIAPRPWRVEQGAQPFIVDAKGKNLASVYFNKGADKPVADLIVEAVNVCTDGLADWMLSEKRAFLRLLAWEKGTLDALPVLLDDATYLKQWLASVESGLKEELEQPQPKEVATP